jgi:hypothetical protein
VPRCENPPQVERITRVKLHDPAGQTELTLSLKELPDNRLALELCNLSGIALANGEAERFQVYGLLIAKVDACTGTEELGLRFDARTGRLWLSSNEFKSASLLFLRRWELQDALSEVFGA